MTTTYPHRDSVIRMALALLVNDPTSGLTDAQQAWLRTRLASLEPLTPHEKQKLKPVLLTWSARQRPETTAILEAQLEA